mgnify:CR=1 FL=1
MRGVPRKKLSKVLVDSGPDQGAVWHFGEPVKEARALAEGKAWADLSHLEVVAVSGVDRLKWLNDLTTQQLLDLLPGTWTSALILDHLGHIEHQFLITDDGETSWLITDKDRSATLIDYLTKMKFTLRVDVKDVSSNKRLIKLFTLWYFRNFRMQNISLNRFGSTSSQPTIAFILNKLVL